MTQDQLPSPEELEARAGEIRGKIGRLNQLEAENARLRAYKEETERQKNSSVVRASETEEQLRGELMRAIGELSDAQQAASRLEERAKRAEAEIANVQAERDDAIRAAEESGKILNKVEQRAQKIEQEREVLSSERERLEVELNGLQEQLKGKTKGDTLALRTELEIIIKAAAMTDEEREKASKPKTELGQKAYDIVVGAKNKHKRAYDAVEAESKEIASALNEGREPREIHSPFNKALYRAAITKRGEAAQTQTPAPQAQKPDPRASASGRHTAIAAEAKGDAAALKKVAEDKAALERRLAAAEAETKRLAAKEKEQDALFRRLTAELTSLTELGTQEAKRLAETEARAKQQVEAANKKAADAEQKYQEIRSVLDPIKQKLEASKRVQDELVARAKAAEEKVRAYEVGTEVPESYRQELAELRAQLDAATSEKEALATEKQDLEAKLKDADKTLAKDPAEESDQTYIAELSRIVSIVYHWHKAGKPYDAEVLKALAQLGDRDEDVEQYYGAWGRDTNVRPVRLGAYARARAALSEAAQHDRTGRTEQAVQSFDQAARLFEEAIVEQITDKTAAYHAARLTSQAQSALRKGPQAIAWAHLAERLAPLGEQTAVYFTLCEAYASCGNREKAQEYLALAEKNRTKTTP